MLRKIRLLEDLCYIQYSWRSSQLFGSKLNNGDVHFSCVDFLPFYLSATNQLPPIYWHSWKTAIHRVHYISKYCPVNWICFLETPLPFTKCLNDTQLHSKSTTLSTTVLFIMKHPSTMSFFLFSFIPICACLVFLFWMHIICGKSICWFWDVCPYIFYFGMQMWCSVALTDHS